MTLLILGILVFIGVHLLPTFVPVRQRLIGRIGIGAYKGLFSIISLAGFVLLIVGKASADFVPVWTPPAGSRHAALAVMPFALILLFAAYLPSNIKRFTPNPMLWGVTLWATVHLLANGDLASIILFGALGAFALFDIVSANARGVTQSAKKYPMIKDAAVIAAGFIAYGALLFLHPYLFGVRVLS
jgi:uncharacterized membrane protein